MSLASVKAPDGLPNLDAMVGIPKECFMNTAITSFPFPQDIALLPIGQSAFANTRFTSLTIPACGVINNGAFADCALLEEVTLPEGLTMMNVGAFSDCPELENIRLPASSISLSGTISGSPQVAYTVASGSAHFETRADGRALVKINGSNRYLSYATTLAGNQTLSGITQIDASAFLNNTAITGLVFENGLTVVSANAFSGCTGLISVDLPATTTTLNVNAFGSGGLNTLQRLTIRANTVINRTTGIAGAYDGGFTVYVPADLVDDYTDEDATGWTSRTIAAIEN